MTSARVTQGTARVVSDGSPQARITQATVRVVSDSSNRATVTQATVRVVSTNLPDPAASSAWPVVFVAT